MKIIICEDDKKILEFIKNIIQNYIMINDWDFNVVLVTQTPKDVVDYIEKNNVNGECYFLDIDFGENEISGVELGEKIRVTDPFAKLIYVTSHDEMRIEVLDKMLEPFSYIMKNCNDFKNKLRATLEKIYIKYMLELSRNRIDNKIPVKIGNRFLFFDIKDVLYFETFGNHKILLKTFDNEEYIFFGKLSDIEKLNKVLMRFSRSYVINIDNIKSCAKDSIIFENNTTYQFPDVVTKELRKIIKNYKINVSSY